MYDQGFYHIETNQYIYCPNQVTGFYMMGAFVLNRLIDTMVGSIQINYAKIRINISVIGSLNVWSLNVWVTPTIPERIFGAG